MPDVTSMANTPCELKFKKIHKATMKMVLTKGNEKTLIQKIHYGRHV